MFGVLIGEKHTYKDWGLILNSKVISPPSPQFKKVSVPMRDGSLDLTEALTGDVKYGDRTITLKFTVIDARNVWESKISEIANYLHGQRLHIICDDDVAFYYVGRVTINEWTSEKNIGKLVIECSVEPYKYDVQSSAEDWLWDSFDFEQGIINECGELIVAGTSTYTLLCRRKKTVPVITASAAMFMTFEGIEYSLVAGTQKIYDIMLSEGENVLTFTGNGTVTIEYTGGSL